MPGEPKPGNRKFLHLGVALRKTFLVRVRCWGGSGLSGLRVQAYALRQSLGLRTARMGAEGLRCGLAVGIVELKLQRAVNSRGCAPSMQKVKPGLKPPSANAKSRLHHPATTHSKTGDFEQQRHVDSARSKSCNSTTSNALNTSSPISRSKARQPSS